MSRELFLAQLKEIYIYFLDINSIFGHTIQFQAEVHIKVNYKLII